MIERRWYAVKNHSGEWVEDAVSTTEKLAWIYASDNDDDFPCHPEYHLSESGEAAGYRCVEVELAEPGTTEALKMAREDFAIVDNFDQQKFTEGTAAAMAHHAAWMRLQEVLGRVTDNAKGEK